MLRERCEERFGRRAFFWGQQRQRSYNGTAAADGDSGAEERGKYLYRMLVQRSERVKVKID